MRNLYLLFCGIIAILLITGCSTLSKTVVYESYTLRNKAAENVGVARDFIARYNYDKALEYLNEALKFNKLSDDVPGTAVNYYNIGKVQLLLEDYNGALRAFTDGLSVINREPRSGDFLKREEALLLAGMGESYYLLGNGDLAEKYYNDSLKIETGLGNGENIGVLYSYIARVETGRGNFDKALGYFSQTTAIFEKLYKSKELSNAKILSSIYYSTAHLYSKKGSAEKSLEFLYKALALDRLIENSIGIADDYFAVYQVKLKLNDMKSALDFLLKSKELYRALDKVAQYREAVHELAAIYYSEGRYKEYFSLKKEEFLLSKETDKGKVASDIYRLRTVADFEKIFDKDEAAEIDGYLR